LICLIIVLRVLPGSAIGAVYRSNPITLMILSVCSDAKYDCAAGT
jgi:hypothetical protein